MNTSQYKNAFLRSKVSECLRCIRFSLGNLMSPNAFIRQLSREDATRNISLALAYARQLPVNSKTRAIRAHIVQAQEALRHAR